jgi:hypothetical protein
MIISKMFPRMAAYVKEVSKFMDVSIDDLSFRTTIDGLDIALPVSVLAPGPGVLSVISGLWIPHPNLRGKHVTAFTLTGPDISLELEPTEYNFDEAFHLEYSL